MHNIPPATGQFGKNPLGDKDKLLPTNHGFDEFFGNLYHLNAEEEPETEFYPKDPDFRKRFGPRGVIHFYADGRIENTGPLTRKRMETADDEFTAAALKFIDKANTEGKPFFADQLWLFDPVQQELGKWLMTFREFPPRQPTASFNIDDIMQQMQQMRSMGGAAGAGAQKAPAQ